MRGAASPGTLYSLSAAALSHYRNKELSWMRGGGGHASKSHKLQLSARPFEGSPELGVIIYSVLYRAIKNSPNGVNCCWCPARGRRRGGETPLLAPTGGACEWGGCFSMGKCGKRDLEPQNPHGFGCCGSGGRGPAARHRHRPLSRHAGSVAMGSVPARVWVSPSESVSQGMGREGKNFRK